MKKLILAIESSCDETAMTIIDTNKKILANKIFSQADFFENYGGVIPELASRMHVDNIFYLFEEVLSIANIEIKDIDYICVTAGPGLIGSLLVGINFANSLAQLYNIPIIPINHMQGHIYAINDLEQMQFPHLSLVVSGGHTDLVYLDKTLNFELLGSTLDDACGESYDKIAKLLDLGYPGGPKIEQLANIGANNIDFPLPLNDQSFNFSFSGLKSACFNYVNQAKMKKKNIKKEDIATSFEASIKNILLNKLKLAIAEKQPKQISIVGGVSNNKNIVKYLQEHVGEILIPNKGLSSDNSLMIALVGIEKIRNNDINYNKYINAIPNITVEYDWGTNAK